ncbi:MAG: diaminobutyrate--2-oxoglutarate transaminase [Clostridia bacterium]|nr:diaminobutyrate--2-oxoglutarate transaminase [Clostridia bacterium]
MDIFGNIESNVRSYCRSFPDLFTKAKGSKLVAASGKEYIDFFAGAGALNYGHNNDFIKKQVIDYIMGDGVIHALDMYTQAKKEFLVTFNEYILKPRKLNYKIQFPGPTGTNAVEAALKLARKVKNRTGIFSFMGAFHGMSLGSLAVTSNSYHRKGAGIPLDNVTFIPYCNTFSNGFDSIDYLTQILADSHSGVEKPAAIILETVQAEGGINVAPVDWLQRLAELCRQEDILLICDDIQVGCDRTGTYFSFERAGIIPDIVILSKSISGYGFPLSLLLIRPELDIWQPGEHNGTFRGNQLAFVAGRAALEYRKNTSLSDEVRLKARLLESFLKEQIASIHRQIEIRGIGMIWGVDLSRCGEGDLAKEVARRCFELGLIIERVGRGDTVMKIMPPLNISRDELMAGCQILGQAIRETLSRKSADGLKGAL